MLKISGNKLLFLTYEDDKEVWTDVSDDIIFHLEDDCYTEEATLKDILDLIKPHSAFLAPLLTVHLEEFLEEAYKPFLRLAGASEEPSLESLELYRNTSIEDGRLTSYTGMHGIAYGIYKDGVGHREALPGETPELIYYSTSFIPINELAHLPVVLNDDVVVTEEGGLSRKALLKSSRAFIPGILEPEGNVITRFFWGLLYKLLPKHRKLLEYKQSFTLYEILYTIFYEISFYGPTENRDQTKSKLMEAIKDWEDSEE